MSKIKDKLESLDLITSTENKNYESPTKTIYKIVNDCNNKYLRPYTIYEMYVDALDQNHDPENDYKISVFANNHVIRLLNKESNRLTGVFHIGVRPGRGSAFTYTYESYDKDEVIDRSVDGLESKYANKYKTNDYLYKLSYQIMYAYSDKILDDKKDNEELIQDNKESLNRDYNYDELDNLSNKIESYWNSYEEGLRSNRDITDFLQKVINDKSISDSKAKDLANKYLRELL